VVEDFAEMLRHPGPTMQMPARFVDDSDRSGSRPSDRCANVASFLLARGLKRIGSRRARGAGLFARADGQTTS